MSEAAQVFEGNGAGVNETEIERIVGEIPDLAGREGPPPSIGGISPLRAQVDALMKRLEALPALLFERHRLLVRRRGIVVEDPPHGPLRKVFAQRARLARIRAEWHSAPVDGREALPRNFFRNE